LLPPSRIFARLITEMNRSVICSKRTEIVRHFFRWEGSLNRQHWGSGSDWEVHHNSPVSIEKAVLIQPVLREQVVGAAPGAMCRPAKSPRHRVHEE